MFRLPHWSSIFAMAIVVSGIGMVVVLDSMDGDEPLNNFGSIPDFELIERSGETVTLSDLTGEIWIANLIFTHCAGTCPMMTLQMRALGNLLPESVRLVSITVDPSRDTPEVLTEYAALHGAGPDWLFLTGERDEIYRLAQDGFHLAVDDTVGTEIEPITHSTRIVLVDQQGQIRNYYDGTTQDSHDLIEKDIETLLDRAG